MPGVDKEPRAQPITVQGITTGGGWYLTWGPSVTDRNPRQIIVLWALGTDGLTIVPVVGDLDGTLRQADYISTDWSVGHPFYYPENPIFG